RPVAIWEPHRASGRDGGVGSSGFPHGEILIAGQSAPGVRAESEEPAPGALEVGQRVEGGVVVEEAAARGEEKACRGERRALRGREIRTGGLQVVVVGRRDQQPPRRRTRRSSASQVI